MLNKFNEIKQLIEVVEEDVYSFYMNNNKTAGRRAVRVLRNLRDLSDEFKKEIQERKKII
jgi:succinate dehydrogenase flavin-adding protein (antitoxin of CptAB toxin-antitoxin module)